MISKEPFAEEGFALMGAAFEVHNEIGGGLLEEFYQECFEIELELRNIPFVPKDKIQSFYKNRPLKKSYEPDLRAFGRIVIELKSVSALEKNHEAQLLNYMRLTKSPVGYLINFGPDSDVQWKRFFLSEFLTEEEKNKL